MAYKVIDIYKDLPRTNCSDCGRGSCFAFASAVFLEGAPLVDCPQLQPEQLGTMQAKLAAERGTAGGQKAPSAEQALGALLETVRDADLSSQSGRAGGEWTATPAEGVRLRFLDSEYLATTDGVQALDGQPATIWVKVFLLIYLTRATGRPPSGTWVAYSDLPNTISKARSFEESAARIATAFAGRKDELAHAALALGAERAQAQPAEVAYLLPALPRVPVLLLFWDGDEEFPARASLLLDRDVLDYLDQEALVFLAEALVARLLGQDLSALVG